MDLLLLLDFITETNDYDFYYTKDNTRIYITDINNLKTFLRGTSIAYGYRNKGDYQGIIVAWKSIGGDKKRYYIKIKAKSKKVAQDLLTVLLWNFNKDLFCKIKKDSQFLEVMKFKGFRFEGSRGTQILLHRKPNDFVYKYVDKESDN